MSEVPERYVPANPEPAHLLPVDTRMRQLAQVYRALAVELDDWQAQNGTVRPIDDNKAPVVYKLHVLVQKHKAAVTAADKTAYRVQMKSLVATLGGTIPTDFGFEQNEVEGLERLMLDGASFSILAPYHEVGAAFAGISVRFW
jgi:hypothetical protein